MLMTDRERRTELCRFCYFVETNEKPFSPEIDVGQLN
jgi:hypothetical protein